MSVGLSLCHCVLVTSCVFSVKLSDGSIGFGRNPSISPYRLRYSGVTAPPGVPAPPEGPRVLGAPAQGKEKIFCLLFVYLSKG